MSLINEMLRDLDARHAAENERNGLAKNVRALPGSTSRSKSPLLMPLLAALLGGVAVWLGMRNFAPEAPVAPAVPQAAPQALPAVALTPPPLVAPLPEAAPDSTEKKLKLTTQISALPALPRIKVESEKPLTETAKPALVRPATAAATIAQATPPASQSPQISKSPHNSGSAAEQAEAEYQRGYAALRRGAAAEAGDAFRAALKLQSTHINARQALLSQLVEQKQWQAAEVVALDGIETNPQRSDWVMIAARIMFDRGDTTQALDTLTQYASGAKQNADYQVFHALLLQRSNRQSEAIVCYQNALALRPGEGRWWYALGRALDADQRGAEARLAYEKARDSSNLPADLAQIVDKRLH